MTHFINKQKYTEVFMMEEQAKLIVLKNSVIAEYC